MSSEGYASISGYIAPTTNNDIKKLGYDSAQPFFNYPSEVISNSSHNKYYCNYYYYASGNKPIYTNVGYPDITKGAFHCMGDSNWSFNDGVRLCYRPIS